MGHFWAILAPPPKWGGQKGGPGGGTLGDPQNDPPYPLLSFAAQTQLAGGLRAGGQRTKGVMADALRGYLSSAGRSSKNFIGLEDSTRKSLGTFILECPKTSSRSQSSFKTFWFEFPCSADRT